ncbi:MAG: DUF1343 domain-containing protein [Kiritimatiellae bacterium]|nr:DUF1343 domain-containing protein [Kiritimatiellia bacterium]
MGMVNYAELEAELAKTNEPLGLLTMQATSTTRRLMAKFPGRLKALFSAEHGFFGNSGPGEHTASAWHPYWNLPIHSLYGVHRKPSPEMLDGIGRIVIDLCDIGVRCYTYLATLKNVLEACAEANIPVTILDRQIPMGNVLDGPMRKPSYASFVAPINVPLCHGMTPGECAIWIRTAESLDLDLSVVRLDGWTHRNHDPWPNFVPPSPAIRSWDCAVAYPMTVFSEAYPAVDVDRDGPLSFRVVGAPWMDAKGLMKDLQTGLDTCGVAMRPYRYIPRGGSYAGFALNGILFSVSRPYGFYPATAGILIFTALLQHHGDKVSFGANPEWLDKLLGSSEVRDTIRSGDLSDLFQGWIEAQDEYLKTKVDLYRQ